MKTFARLRRHWHCLFGMFKGHRALTMHTIWRIAGMRLWQKTHLVACDCGQVFFHDGRYDLTDWLKNRKPY